MSTSGFRINGCNIIAPVDPRAHLDQSHAVLSCIARVMVDEEKNGRPNDEIIMQAVEGAASLVELAALGWVRWTEK